MSMNPNLRAAWRRELDEATALEKDGAWRCAFVHLERAHILGQRHTVAHAHVHLRMLRNGWKQGNAHEVLGQVMRTLGALAKTLVWVPLGNTGGANVNPLKPMPIPADLKPYLD